jgi:hypothetical protein
MSDVPTLRKEYNKLKKKYAELPEFKEFTLVFGFPKEDEFKSVLTIFKAVKKTPFNVAHWVMNILSPSDTISANDNRVTKGMRGELLVAMKKLVIADKKLSIRSFEASQSDDPEKVMAEAMAEAVEDLKGVAGFLKKVLEKIVEGWSKAEDNNDSTYHW